jgi:protein-tyrosine phosphatase
LADVLTELPYGLAGKAYRSPLPFSWLFDPRGKLLDAFLAAGVDTVVMLTPEEEALDLTGKPLREVYTAHGLEVMVVPVVDFSVPEDGLLREAIPRALEALKCGRNLAIHCHAGIGRTGMFAACLAKVVFDMQGGDAVRWVRRFVPEAVENRRQQRFVRGFTLEDTDTG